MYENYVHSPHCYQGSNSQFDEYHSEEENVPETQEPIMSPPLAPTQAHAISSPARSWSIKEDEALIACYMEHCTDAIIGTNQKGTTLWRKVSESYDVAQVNRPNELPPRNAKMLENRRRRLAGEINLWVGCYEEWRVKIRWGMSKKERDAAVEADVEESSSSGKRNRVDEDGDTVIGSGSNTSGGILRPDGVKKAKAKKKGK
ncbi:Glutathione S-transferase T3 [Bienertia sinuspersici]